MKKHEIVEWLEDYERYLIADGKEGKANAVMRASESLRRARRIPGDPAELDGIGEVLRDEIAEYQFSGENEEYTRLREKHGYLDAFTSIEGLGPKLASRLHRETGAESLDELKDADLTSVQGIGPATADRIRGQLP